MAELKNKIENEVKDALRSGDQLRRSVLSLLLSAIKNKEIERKGQGKAADLSDDDIMELIGSEVKKRKDSIEQYKKGGRNELAEKENKEMEILQDYLPEQLSEDEIEKEVTNTIQEQGASGMQDMGRVIGEVMKKLKGRADGSIVSRIVKDKLSNA